MLPACEKLSISADVPIAVGLPGLTRLQKNRLFSKYALPKAGYFVFSALFFRTWSMSKLLELHQSSIGSNGPAR